MSNCAVARKKPPGWRRTTSFMSNTPPSGVVAVPLSFTTLLPCAGTSSWYPVEARAMQMSGELWGTVRASSVVAAVAARA